jgi:hypothetical protein
MEYFRTKEVMMNWAKDGDREDKESMQNFGVELSWKMTVGIGLLFLL